MKTTSNYRYPGSAPFQDSSHDRLIFFGRGHEEKLLFHKILAEDLLVLFGKSGMGKTSLLNAGLMQPLRENDYIPLPIRLNNADTDPLQTLYAEIADIVEQKGIEYKAGDKQSLWRFFSTTEFWTPNDTLLTPVLILDQFEEFFTIHSSESRNAFISQLAELTRNRAPKAVKQSLTTEGSRSHTDAFPETKIIIAIREDYLGQLEEMSREIPGILQNRYRLPPLNRERAKKAIIEPAKLENDRIHSTAFSYKPEAVEAMLDFLCRRRKRGEIIVSDEVESFQLQLLCSHIEDKLISGSAKRIVEKDDLGGEAGMKRVLEGFYDRLIKGRGAFLKQRRTRNLCEKGLVSVRNRRLSLEEEEIKRKFHVPEKELNALVNDRLLRAEPRVGSVYYEISHDTLVEPIRESQKKRFRKKVKIGGVIAGIFFVVMAIFFATSQLAQNKTDTINQLYTQLETQINKWDFDEAQNTYEQIIQIDNKAVRAYLELGRALKRWSPEKAIQIYNQAISNRIEHSAVYYELANVLSRLDRLEESIENYKKAIEIDPELASAYAGLGKVHAKQKAHEKARENYEKALSIDKEMPDVYEKLALLYVEQDKPDDAIGVYRQAIRVRPEYANIYHDIADEFDKRGMNNFLDEIYEIASKVELKSASYYDDLGIRFSKQSNDDKAVEMYKKGIEIEPAYKYTYYNLGITLSKQGNYDDAIEQFGKAIVIDPKFVYAYNGLGIAFSDQGKYDEAIEQFGKAIVIDPKNANAYNGSGNALWYQRKYDEAIEQYKKAIEIDPKDISVKVNLAEVYLISGHTEKAFLLSNELLQYEKLSIDVILAMHSVSIASLLFQGKRHEALLGFQELISYYKRLDHEYKRSWGYGLYKNFISNNKELNHTETQLLLKLVEILEMPKPEGDNTIKELEALAAKLESEMQEGSSR